MAVLGQGVRGLANSQEEFKATIADQVGQLTEQVQRLSATW